MRFLFKIFKYLFFVFCFLLLVFGHWFFSLFFLIIYLFLTSKFSFSFPEEACFLWLGVPGSGKTTIAAWICNHYLSNPKNTLRVFSNVPISNTLKYDWKKDFGHYDMTYSIIICDEAGIYLNGRNWKQNFDNDSLEQAKKFRHDHMTLHFFSQCSDEDPVIRNLSNTTYVVEKSIIKWFVKFRAIGKKIDIPENTRKQDVCDFWVPFSTKYVFCPPAWKLFDSWESKKLPPKEFKQW